ncbi:MAG: hypothetical protein ACHQD9_08105, partial [Chitinophagales bacterium]
MKRNLLLIISILLIFSSENSSAQKKSKQQTPEQPPYTAADVRLQGFGQAKKLQENSIVSQVEFRNVGPTIMSGRVVDVDANPDN